MVRPTDLPDGPPRLLGHLHLHTCPGCEDMRGQVYDRVGNMPMILVREGNFVSGDDWFYRVDGLGRLHMVDPTSTEERWVRCARCNHGWDCVDEAALYCVDNASVFMHIDHRDLFGAFGPYQHLRRTNADA